MPTASRSIVTGEFADKKTIVGADGLLGVSADAGQAGDDDAVAEDARVCARPDGAGVGPAAARRDGRGRRQRGVLGPGRRRSSPAGSSAPRRRRAHRVADPGPTPVALASCSRCPMSIDTNYRHASRRHFLRGVGVALALPWMESLPIFAQSAPPPAQGANTPPLRLGIVFFSNGVEPTHWWAKGAGADMEIGPAPHADDAASRGHALHQRAVQPDRAGLDEPAPRPHERAVGRAGEPRPEGDSRRHLDGPGARLADRQPHGHSQPGARHRAERAAPRRRAVDDLRLEPVLGLADQAGDQGNLSVAHVRSPGRRRQRPAARSQHPRRGPAGFAEPAARRSAAATT